MNPNNWQIYGGHIIFMHLGWVRGGQFHDAFSIRKYIPGPDHDELEKVYERGIFHAKKFDSEDEARASAENLARAWIDKQDDDAKY